MDHFVWSSNLLILHRSIVYFQLICDIQVLLLWYQLAKPNHAPLHLFLNFVIE